MTTTQKSAVVTGSSSGIGLGIAEGFAAAGMNVMMNGIEPRDEIQPICDRLATAHGVKVAYEPANMMAPDGVRDLIGAAEAAFGHVDVLVNNAGIQFVSPVEDFPDDKWQAIISLNLSAAFFSTKAVMAGMKARGWGRIINVASAHGLVASPFKSAYVAAKHGIVGLTKTIALEGAEHGVTVNAICPGYVWTPLVEKQIPDTAKARGMTEEQVKREVLLAVQPTKKFATVEELSGLAVFLCSDAAASITGTALPVDGGWPAHCPCLKRMELVMKRHILTAVFLAATATLSSAHDLEGVQTREVDGLVGPANGAQVKAQRLARQSLAEEGIAELAGRTLRMRYFEIGGPDGLVSVHSHGNRPAVFSVLTGQIYEFTNKGKEGILHRTGGLAMEAGPVAHWWWNAEVETVTLIAFDVQPGSADGVTVAPVPESAPFDLPDARDVQHDLLGAIDLGAHFGDGTGDGWVLSTYRTTIEPGGVMPAFTAAGEPLQAFVWEGAVTEHRSDAQDAVVLDKGAGSSLAGGAAAYWENTGDVAATLYFGAVEPVSEVDGVPQVGVRARAGE